MPQHAWTEPYPLHPLTTIGDRPCDYFSPRPKSLGWNKAGICSHGISLNPQAVMGCKYQLLLLLSGHMQKCLLSWLEFDHTWAFHMLGILKHPTLDLQTHATVRRSCLAFFWFHANIHLAFAALCFPRLFLSWNPNPIQNVLKPESQTVRVLFLTLHHWVQLRLLWPQISGQTLRWNWWNRGWNRGVCRQGPSEPCPASEVGKKRKQDSVLRWKLHHTVPPAHFHSPVSCLDDHPSNGYNPLLHGKISSRYRSFYCPQLRQEATTRTWELWWPVLLVFYRGADAHCIDTVMILQWCPHFCGIIWLGSYEGSFFRSLASHAWE